jgi:hypothetical protein
MVFNRSFKLRTTAIQQKLQLEQQQMVFKTAISNNTDAITAEAT